MVAPAGRAPGDRHHERARRAAGAPSRIGLGGELAVGGERVVDVEQQPAHAAARRRSACKRLHHRAEHLRHALALRLRHQQAGLGAPPQHVLRGPRPFALDEIAQLALGEAGAEILAQVAVADHRLRMRAVAPEDRRSVASGMCGWLPKNASRASTRGTPPKSLPGQRRAVGPRGLHAREVRRELVQRVLGETPVGGDLAAEHRQHRRRARRRRPRAACSRA